MDHKAHVNSLLEDGWFFGNSLANKPRSTSRMVRCYSDPRPCSTTKEENLVSTTNESQTNNLLRTPSLPPSWGSDMKYSQEEGGIEEDEPRMGDLIRQAMPLPLRRGRRLDRTPSLPPLRGKEPSRVVLPSIQNDPNQIGRLTRRTSIESSSVLSSEKGPNEMPRLNRRASIGSSMVLPPKYTSKTTKLSSNSKNSLQRELDLPNVNESAKDETKSQNLKSKSQKSISDLEIEELQGFKDLGFSFDHKQVNKTAAQILPALQRKGSIDSSINDNVKVRRTYLSEAWEHRSSSPISAPLILIRADQQPPSAEDMKAQIKFWARVVASNVRQEC